MELNLDTALPIAGPRALSVRYEKRLAPQPLTSGTLEVRLAETEADVWAAKRLRYRVFYEEMGANASAATIASQLDEDDFDDVADHLLVLDHALGNGPDAVVGTYRLIRRDAAARLGGFYTASEYDIGAIMAYDGEVLELGRSCTAAPYRTRPTMQLLWKGIAAYVFRNEIALMFGCASLPGNDVEALRLQLAYLHHRHLAPVHLRARALPERYVAMDLMPPEQIDERQALSALPPLIKGYLRLGGGVGEGAVIDRQFNTTDVCIIVETGRVSDKYYRHYEREAREVPA